MNPLRDVKRLPAPGGHEEFQGGSHGGLDLARVAQILFRRWPLVLLLPLATFAAAWHLVPADRTVYSSTAVVRLYDPTPRLTGGLIGGFGESMQSVDFMTSQIHVLRSRSVIGEVVDQYGLRLFPGPGLSFSAFSDISITDPGAPDRVSLRFAPTGYTARANGSEARAAYGEPVEVAGVRFAIGSAPEVVEAEVSIANRESVISFVLTGLVPVQRDRSAILDIRYRDPDPFRSLITVNGLARSFQRQNAQGVQESSRRRREFIEEQSLQAEVELARAQQDLTAFRSRTGQVDPERGAADRAELVAIDGQRDQIQAEFRLYSGFLERVERARGEEIDQELRTFMAAVGGGTAPLLSQLYTQFVEYQTQRDQLLAGGRAPTHPEVERLTTLMVSSRSSVVEAARTQLSSIRLRMTSLDDQRARVAAMIRAVPDFGSEEARLFHEVEVARSSMQALRAEYQRARMAETVELGQVDLLDSALATEPQRVGNRNRTLAIALVLGLLLGGGGALVLETTDTRVRRRFDAESLMTAPPLAVIPPVGTASTRRLGFGRLLPSGRSMHARSRDLVISGDSFKSVASEAYRLLRTNLIFIDGGNELRTLVVTSSLAGEGKTTTAANLAVAFAREGRRVLLIDCDLRRPRLHHLFDAGNGPGFTDVLLGRVNGSAPAPAMPMEGLSFLPRGAYDERAIEVLTGPRMRMLMAGFRETYDLVIFDTPPVLLASEAAALAGIADGVLLVVRAGSTRRRDVRSSVQQLTSIGANLVGFVLNDPDSVAAAEGEYGYTQYYAAVE